jgi:hypothetical protein
MGSIPCHERLFPFRINANELSKPYLRWLKHLGERLGVQHALSVWDSAFTDYDDAWLNRILSSGWHKVTPDEINPIARANQPIKEFFSTTSLGLSEAEVIGVIEKTPPIAQIRKLFSNDTVEKEITAYEALHLRFDALACLAEALIKQHGKQGEFIVYDLVVSGRLASGKGQTGSVDEFLDSFTAEEETPSLFTAGLQTELISKTEREVVLYVRECEWARYFRERHPSVGYLMACSTDEVSYKAFNANLRMQRSSTLMEDGEWCDFRIYALDS